MGQRQRTLEVMVIDPDFWPQRRVFLTGHTGFKGAWMSLLLRRLGAEVHGYSLAPDTKDGLFNAAGVERDVHHEIADIRDLNKLRSALTNSRADIVIHMAAQSLVRLSYTEPVTTYETNVMGTVHVLEAVRQAPDVQAVVIVTSDKCYENFEWARGYHESDRLGGHDPYSNSKGCAELVTDAYRNSFFRDSPCRIASARAGNVIGGGDWSKDRLVPDAMRAFLANDVLRIRNPHAVRPWQHVLDPVCAYLLLAQRLVQDEYSFAEAWNFGPGVSSEVSVGSIIERLIKLWGPDSRWEADSGHHPHEAAFLKLDCSKARSKLGWVPLFDLDQSLSMSSEWYRAFGNGEDMRAVTLRQIERALTAAGVRT